MSWRCRTCNGLIGPEDAEGANTQPEACARCRKREAAAARREAQRQANANHPSAVAGRQLKALAMAVVIDANFVRQFPKLDPFDQAGRILLASKVWSDAQWETIGELALKPNGEHYERKAISDETRAEVRGIYEGRARAPLASRRAS